MLPAGLPPAPGWSPQDLHCLWLTHPCAHANFSMVSYSAEFISLGLLVFSPGEADSFHLWEEWHRGFVFPVTCVSPALEAGEMALPGSIAELLTVPWEESCPGGVLANGLL